MVLIHAGRESRLVAKILHPTKWINIYREVVDAPPRELRPFLAWCLDGANLALVIAACASVLLGVIETYVAALLGYIIDVVIETPPNRLFDEQWPFLLTAIGFLTLVRPTSFFLSSSLLPLKSPDLCVSSIFQSATTSPRTTPTLARDRECTSD